MMRPQRCWRMWGIAARAQRNGPVRFTSMTRRQASSSRSSTSWVVAMPALLTRMSSPPRPEMVRRTISRAWLASDTSTAIVSARPPLCSMASAVVWAVASSMSATATAAPASASAAAMPAPMPAPPPVTMATRPESSPSSGLMVVHLEQGAQAAVKRRRPARHQAGLEDLEQLVLGRHEAHRPLLGRPRARLLGPAQCQDRDGAELARLGRHVAALAEAQLVDAVVRLDEVGVLPGGEFPLGVDVSPRRLHAGDQGLALPGPVVVVHRVTPWGVRGRAGPRAPVSRSGAEGEGAADGAHHEPVAQPAGERDHRLEARAVLGHDVVQLERAKRVDDARDALLAETAQVESADHRVDLRNFRHARRPPAD